MKIKIEKELLLEGILKSQKALATKSVIPVLEGLLIIAKDNSVTIVGNNIDLSITTTMECEVIVEGSTVIDAKILSKTINALPNGEVEIEVIDSLVQITSGEIIFKLGVMDSADYPSVPEFNSEMTVELNQDLLKRMFKKTTYALAQDDTRPILTGLLMQFKDKLLTTVGLDGYRLAVNKEVIESSLETDIVVPGKTVLELAKFLEGDKIITLSISDKYIKFDLGNTIIISRLLEGQYINYVNILPNFDNEVKVNRQEFLNAIARTLLLHEDKNVVKLTIDKEKMNIITGSVLGNYSENIKVKSELDEFTIAFNAKYIQDALKSSDDEEVIFVFGNNVQAATMKDSKNSIHLILPVKIMK